MAARLVGVDLAPKMLEVARVLRTSGWFAFSIEKPSEACDSYRLEPSGRYAQSLAHVRKLALALGLAERSCTDVAIRKHGARALPGQLLVLQKPGHEQISGRCADHRSDQSIADAAVSAVRLPQLNAQ